MSMTPVYLQPTATVERRVDDLLQRMSVREKLAQLTGFWISKPQEAIASGELFSAAYFRRHCPHGIGSVGPSNIPLDLDVRYRNALQRYLREETRLRIPALVHDEGCHGLMKPGATCFPSPLGLACSWDLALLEDVYDVVAREMRARGAHHALTPVIDLARDPRWGRIEETYGEDPYLNGRLGLAAVRGLQGSSDGTIDAEHVLATLKHFAAHGSPEGGLNCSSSLCGERELREGHIAPFAHVIRHGAPAAVMPSYNDIDGVPAHGNAWLLKSVLRDELGFQGLIVSDYFGVARLHAGHRAAGSKAEAARLALEAGLQLELPDGETFPLLEDAVSSGQVRLEQVDQAVAPLLAWKFKLGLFENPFVEEAAAHAVVIDAARQPLAQRAAEESIVLLKNDGGLLPLAPERYPRIAVIGPNAAVARLGGYSGEPLRAVSIYEGIRARVGGAATVTYAPGCVLVKDEPPGSYDRWKLEDVALATDEENRPLIAEATVVARDSDIVILVVGETETLCREAYSDRVVGDATTLELRGSQRALIEAILATRKPVAVYLMNGRPLSLEGHLERIPVLLEGWYMGQETGTAAARILFGDVCPSGKLTVSFPKSVGHIPAYYSKRSFSAQFPYIFSENSAVFPFGFGLSYTTFEYSAVCLERNEISPGEPTEVSVVVTNTGSRAGAEVVQLYIRAEIPLLSRPVKELKGFERIDLEPGQSRTVRFRVDEESLGVWGLRKTYAVECGRYHILIGGSSQVESGPILTVR